MKKSFFVLLTAGLVLMLAVPAAAQKTEDQAKAWLANYTQPAAINVHGVWQSKDWGSIVLSQAADSREVTGTGDEWDIMGVVSGKQIYLVFYSSSAWNPQPRIGYSAVLSPQDDDTLVGGYNSGLKDNPNGKKMTVTRTLKRPGGLDPAKWADYMPPVPPGKAFVYVYRHNAYLGRVLSPAVYCDDAQVASISNGSYFIVKVAPGTHKFRSNDRAKTEVTVDAKAGEKYYVRVEIHTGFGGNGVAVAASAEQGDRDVHALMPLDSSKIADKKTVLVPGFDQTGPPSF